MEETKTFKRDLQLEDRHSFSLRTTSSLQVSLPRGSSSLETFLPSDGSGLSPEGEKRKAWEVWH